MFVGRLVYTRATIVHSRREYSVGFGRLDALTQGGDFGRDPLWYPLALTIHYNITYMGTLSLTPRGTCAGD